MVCFGLVFWSGLRTPLAIAISCTLFGVPLILLLLPRVAKVYLYEQKLIFSKSK
jgi:hypothetical protein